MRGSQGKYISQVVIEVHVSGAQEATEQRSVGGKYGGDINVCGPQHDEANSSHPLVEVSKHLRPRVVFDLLTELRMDQEWIRNESGTDQE
mgnify:CR=1 FL=1